MKDHVILTILQKMQEIINEEQMENLNEILHMVLCECEVVSKKKEIMLVNKGWEEDLSDFLVTKTLEGKSVDTVNQYRYELAQVLQYTNKSIAEISEDDIFYYLQEYKRIRQVSNQTLENKRLVYSSFFSWLHNNGRIRKNPILSLGRIKVPKKLRQPFSDEERELLFQSCLSLRDKALIELLYSAAIRVSELTKLDIDDIKFAEKEFVVYGKGAKERTVYINAKANVYLKAYLDSRKDKNKALFVSEKRPYNRLTKGGIEDILRRIGRKSGIKKVHPHRFRRTAATNALNRGMPLQEVSKLLGHAKTETTMLYCNLNQESIKFNHKKYLSA